MSNEIKQPYEVLHAIGHKGERYNRGSIIELTDEEAQNIGDEYIKKYFKPISEIDADIEPDESASVQQDVASENIDGAQVVNDTTPEQTETKVEDVETLSEPNINE